MTLSESQLGFVRGLGTLILMGILSYVGDASHLNGVVSVSGASIISALALSLEHYFESKSVSGKALFGSTTVKA